MTKIQAIFFFLWGLFLTPGLTYAQEIEEDGITVPESAEVYLEDYSDAFQENFFEALKQKGIENYEKAINFLLKCKQIDAESNVVDHELAKAYLADKQYNRAQVYGVEALVSEPTNVWFLNTLVGIMDKQGSSIESIHASIPFKNDKLKENLALIYFKRNNYDDALSLLQGLTKSSFTENLSAKIKDSLKKKEVDTANVQLIASNSEPSDPLKRNEMHIRMLIETDSIAKLEELSAEALESYPSQPYFYFAQGYALNKSNRHQEATEVLETALDYLLDDVPLANRIYKELVDAYTALNNVSMANMYLRKIKPGF